jgi:hypothetical protein
MSAKTSTSLACSAAYSRFSPLRLLTSHTLSPPPTSSPTPNTVAHRDTSPCAVSNFDFRVQASSLLSRVVPPRESRARDRRESSVAAGARSRR